jgi:hypothetical protein
MASALAWSCRSRGEGMELQAASKKSSSTGRKILFMLRL